MTTRASDIARPQTTGEEIANAISHGAGVAMGLIALPLLVITAARRNDVWQVVAGSIYATTLVLLYSASTVYHALPSRFPAKRFFRGLDHGAIYLLIAGTYTPFALGALRGPWGWSILAIIWSLAAGGILLKAGLGFRYPRLSLAVYLLMGWLIVIALRPLYRTVGPAGMAWLGAGGLSYTVGVYFYARDYLRYRHFVWHLFVLGGSVCHLVAVARYANGSPSWRLSTELFLDDVRPGVQRDRFYVDRFSVGIFRDRVGRLHASRGGLVVPASSAPSSVHALPEALRDMPQWVRLAGVMRALPQQECTERAEGPEPADRSVVARLQSACSRSFRRFSAFFCLGRRRSSGRL